ncbi:MAG TPA: D-alanyl-D-alanine carboxypeptidase/D-alanyl-D-alanine-endopeptidase [Pyrinomonadaceae bacterium]|nr:D-alanyl-D-alanine carboxypeptidase/D-alanyl-D-alanine-endopeptidase [Pyrinomonadaceae bacterium]
MPKKFSRTLAALLLLTALVTGATPTRAAAPTRAQQQRRERRVGTTAPRPTPTPRVAPTPARSTTTLPAATPTPSLAPTPATSAATPSSSSRSGAPQTLEELRLRVRELMTRPEFASSMLAVKVASLDTGRVLFEENANKWLQPASNLKLYTVAAALDRLTPDYRFVTSVYAPARPDASGAVRGDLIIYGRGDPTYAKRFNSIGADATDEASARSGANGVAVGTPSEGVSGATGFATPAGNGAASSTAARPDAEYLKAIDELAARIAGAGVRRVEGDLVGDESYFAGDALAPGWEWDDLQWWYGAEVSALSINDNSVDLTVSPGARAGDPCRITLGPATGFVTVVDRTRTTPRGTPRDLVVHRPLGQNVLEISGGMPVDDRPFTGSVAVSRPALFFVTLLREALERRGVRVAGRTRTVDARERAQAGTSLPVSSLVEIATRQSPPLSVVAAQAMKPSQNLYTELILRALGKTTATDARQKTDEAGIEAVKTFLRSAGIDDGKVQMVDGSGLSQRNLVTAATTLQLLVHMSRHRFGAIFRDSLPVAGVDGTLRNRMKGTPAQANARAKTGTLSSSTTLSGYVTSAAGERLVFSLMINHPPRERDPRASFTDAITVLLASFAGRS